MKNLLGIAALFAVVFTTGGCIDNKSKSGGYTDTLSVNVDTTADSTVYGECGESTAMHTLELVTGNGKEVMYSLINMETGEEADVQGGLMIGDKLALTAYKAADGTMVANKVINLTTLLGKWVSIDKTFEIKEGGVVVSNVKEPKPVVDWKIVNGKLLLSADTFDIYTLGADSLYLENNAGIFAYKRFTK